jgi:hypothetical protein
MKNADKEDAHMNSKTITSIKRPSCPTAVARSEEVGPGSS